MQPLTNGARSIFTDVLSFSRIFPPFSRSTPLIDEGKGKKERKKKKKKKKEEERREKRKEGKRRKKIE